MLNLLDKMVKTPNEGVERFYTSRGENIVFRDPRRVKAVLCDKRFVRADLMRVVFGDGMVVSEDREGSPRRQILSKQFGSRLVSSFFGHSVAVFKERLAVWERTTQVLNLAEETHRITLEVICRSMLGRPLGAAFEDIAAAMCWAMTTMGRLVSLSVPERLELSPTFQVELQGVIQTFDSFTYSIIEQSRRQSGAPENILSALVQSELSDREVRDELVALLLAGSETSALTLSWSLVKLNSRPDLRERLRTEAESVFQGEPKLEQVPTLKLTRAVVDETLRLCPPVWYMIRKATQDIDVLGQPVKKGATVIVSPYLIHRQDGYWKSGETFQPERCSNSIRPEKTGHYLPFSQGHHVCLGRKPALVEITAVLALFHRDVELEFLDETFPVRQAGTFRHDLPIRVRLGPRP
jgi:cytochrome P450